MKKNENNWTHQKRRITAKELLYGMIEAPINALLAFDKVYPFSVSSDDKMFNCENLFQKINYLRQKKLIKTVIKGNEKFYEITKKGREQIAWNKINKVTKRQSGNWDGFFRIVMFDIPESKKSTREVIRNKLEQIGFLAAQKSVFIYPFECKEEINAISFFCSSSTYLKYLVVQIIDGQEELIDEFIDRGVLNNDDLKSARTAMKRLKT